MVVSSAQWCLRGVSFCSAVSCGSFLYSAVSYGSFLWSVVFPSGRWSFLLVGGLFLWSVVFSYGRRSFLLVGGVSGYLAVN